MGLKGIVPPQEAVPPSLRPLRRWVLWRLVERDGRPTKMPFRPDGRPAKANDPKTWTTLEEALEALKTGRFDGLGFVLGDGITGLDLDWKGWEGDGVPPEALAIVGRLGSYTEWSPSGKGCHVLLRGKLPPGSGNRRALGPKVHLEVYDGRRFFTFTGNRWEGYPHDLEERQEALEALARELLRREAREAPPPPPKPPEPLRLEGGSASPKRLRALLEAYAQRVATAPVGQRHTTLLSYALAGAGLVPHGLSRGEVEAVLTEAGLACGLPLREVQGVPAWALPRGEARPLALEEPTPRPKTYRARVYARLRRWA